jgi:hypothetical protein
MNDHTEARKAILLKACYDMLKKLDESYFVISPMETTVFYDGADCDGSCLKDDIAHELRLEED